MQASSSSSTSNTSSKTQYEKLAEIGTGAYGTVYKAKDLRTGEYVALKLIRIRTDEEGIPTSTLRETAYLKHLERFEHPNIVRLLDVIMGRRNLTETRLYLVFEYVDQDLSKYLEKCPSSGLPFFQVKDFMFQLLRAVDFLHCHLITHRDIKPQNILISSSNVLKLCDFGLARAFHNQMPLTSVVVTLWYRAPEVLLNSQYAMAVDIWSCGCILTELVTRQPLFPGQSDIDQLHKIFNILGLPSAAEWPYDCNLNRESFGICRPQPLQLMFPELEDAGTDLLKRMLDYTPTQRITAVEALEHCFFHDNGNTATIPFAPYQQSAFSVPGSAPELTSSPISSSQSSSDQSNTSAGDSEDSGTKGCGISTENLATKPQNKAVTSLHGDPASRYSMDSGIGCDIPVKQHVAAPLQCFETSFNTTGDDHHDHPSDPHYHSNPSFMYDFPTYTNDNQITSATGLSSDPTSLSTSSTVTSSTGTGVFGSMMYPDETVRTSTAETYFPYYTKECHDNNNFSHWQPH